MPVPPPSSRSRKAPTKAARRRLISILVPVFNEEANVDAAHAALSKVAEEHGGGSVALARTGSRGVRIVFVAGDGTFGDAMVPSVEAAEEVCETGGWEITGWDVATVQRIAPSRADRIGMRGTGR